MADGRPKVSRISHPSYEGGAIDVVYAHPCRGMPRAVCVHHEKCGRTHSHGLYEGSRRAECLDGEYYVRSPSAIGEFLARGVMRAIAPAELRGIEPLRMGWRGGVTVRSLRERDRERRRAEREAREALARAAEPFVF